MSADLNLPKPQFRDQLRSRPIRQALTDIENNFNALRAEVYASLATTAGEVVSARHNAGSLTDNILLRRVLGNGFTSKDYVTELGTPAMKFRVLSGAGIIDGIGVDWSSATSATLTAPAAGKHRIDIIAANTNNTITRLAGAATAAASQPILPALASTQDQLAFLYLTAGTSVLREGEHIFNVDKKSSVYADCVLTGDRNLKQGNYKFNNLVLMGDVNLKASHTASNFTDSYDSLWVVKCLGSVHIAGAITCTGGVPSDSYAVAKFQNTVSANGNSGTGNKRNSGGDGGSNVFGFNNGGTGGAYTQEDAASQSDYGLTDLSLQASIFIIAKNIYLESNILLSGYPILAEAQNNNLVSGGDIRGGGGAGGAAGGNVWLAAENEIFIATGAGINVAGANAGDGGDATTATAGDNFGGSGGGGGAGGIIGLRANNIEFEGSYSIVYSGGQAGAGGIASGGASNTQGNDGSAGEAGELVQIEHASIGLEANLLKFAPFDNFNFDFLMDK